MNLRRCCFLAELFVEPWDCVLGVDQADGPVHLHQLLPDKVGLARPHVDRVHLCVQLLHELRAKDLGGQLRTELMVLDQCNPRVDDVLALRAVKITEEALTANAEELWKKRITSDFF